VRSHDVSKLSDTSDAILDAIVKALDDPNDLGEGRIDVRDLAEAYALLNGRTEVPFTSRLSAVKAP
jgi:hypothetical protein